MFNPVRYITNNNFKLIYTTNTLDIVNYEKINYMEDNKISLSTENQTIVINGKDLRVKKMLDDEIMIVGSILTIEFKK